MIPQVKVDNLPAVKFLHGKQYMLILISEDSTQRLPMPQGLTRLEVHKAPHPRYFETHKEKLPTTLTAVGGSLRSLSQMNTLKLQRIFELSWPHWPYVRTFTDLLYT